MKLSDDMLFGHPVLWEQTDDYLNGLFSSEFSVDLSGEFLQLSAQLDFNCADLAALVDEGGAGCGFYIICRRTYQNRLVEMTRGSSVVQLPADQFFGTVQIRPVVWSKEKRSGWYSRMLHSEYGSSVDFPAAAILAIGREYRFSVDRERLKPFETIFALAASDSLEPGHFKVDPEENKITIYTDPATKTGIDEMRNDPRGRAVLLNAIYLPAVMEVLSQMRGGIGNFEGKAWFRIFEAKCSAAGINATTVSPFEGAQRLLNAPFGQIDAHKESLFD